MGFPPMGSSTLRGSRVEPMRAGIIARTFSFFVGMVGTRAFCYFTLPGANNGFLLAIIPTTRADDEVKD
jgi:hypothetical protein